jgi:hypothetical protein
MRLIGAGFRTYPFKQIQQKRGECIRMRYTAARKHCKNKRKNGAGGGRETRSRKMTRLYTKYVNKFNPFKKKFE